MCISSVLALFRVCNPYVVLAMLAVVIVPVGWRFALARTSLNNGGNWAMRLVNFFLTLTTCMLFLKFVVLHHSPFLLAALSQCHSSYVCSFVGVLHGYSTFVIPSCGRQLVTISVATKFVDTTYAKFVKNMRV